MDKPEYKPTQEDILSMLKHLRHVAPEHATPEKAIRLLGFYHQYYETLEDLHPELIEKILQDFEKH